MVPEILLTVSAYIARSRRPLYASMCPFHDSTALPANPTLSAFDCLRFLLSSDVSFSEQSFTVRRLLNESTARPIGTISSPSPGHFDPHFARNDYDSTAAAPERRKEAEHTQIKTLGLDVAYFHGVLALAWTQIRHLAISYRFYDLQILGFDACPAISGWISSLQIPDVSKNLLDLTAKRGGSPSGKRTTLLAH